MYSKKRMIPPLQLVVQTITHACFLSALLTRKKAAGLHENYSLAKSWALGQKSPSHELDRKQKGPRRGRHSAARSARTKNLQ